MGRVKPSRVGGGATDSDLSRYMRSVRRYPLLDKETEAHLARRWRESGDAEAADQLVGSHQRLVVKIAGQYRGYGLALADLISEGNIGLMQAVDKFDPDRGFRLSTYAMWWIRAAISDYVLRSSSLVKAVTNEHRKKLFFNLRRLKAKIQPLSDNALSASGVSAIARELGVPASEIVLMDRQMSMPDLSLNAAVGDGSDLTWQDMLVDEGADQEADLIRKDEHDKRRALLVDAMAELSDRERRILAERKLRDDPPNLGELGARYGISRERVRQIEVRAFEKLKAAIRRAALADRLIAPSTA
ncbi:MAG: RNA polymerase factor sigma-32 [Rhodospirillales bacterium]